MNFSILALRFRWLQLPTGLLIMLLQRTPAPLVRVLVQLESLVLDQAPVILRSSVAAAAMGAYNSVAGATVFNVTPATPASGAANATFTVAGTAGTPLSIGISVSGAPGNPKSWSVKNTTPLPAGLSVVGGNPVNVVAPYKMTIDGTPTAAGTTSVTVTAWDGLNGTGGNSAKITVTFNIAGGGPVNVAPSITTQPSSQTVTAGGSATFTVAAGGTPAPTYQWQKGGANIVGATGTSLALANVQNVDAGSYTAVATNAAGSVTSAAATLTVNPAAPLNVAPSITTSPSSQSVMAGGSATFTAAASGTPTPTYQWQKGGANIAGATNATLSLGNVQNADAGSYTVVATNIAGSASSAAATLTVTAPPPANTAPVISTPPAGLTVAAGAPATFSVAASGNPAPVYQWKKDGVNLAGATGASYVIAAAASGDAGTYTVVVSNSAGSITSAGATLSVSAVSAPVTTTPVTPPPPATTNPPATTPVAPTAGALLPFPSGLGFASSTVLYVTDSSTNTVQRVTTAGEVTLLAGSPGNAGTLDGFGTDALFNQPGGLIVTSAGLVFVADSANATIRRLGGDGGVTTFAGSSGSRGNSDGLGALATFSSPRGMAADGAGNLYVADATNHTIRKVTPAGLVTTLAGSAGQSGTADGTGSAARFNNPVGVAVDSTGNVFVADRANNVIRKITPAGVVSTLAGVAGISGPDNGTGSGALFNLPGGLVVDSSGNLYVADTGNCTIRKITPAGVVTLLAGLPTVGGLQDGTGLGALFNQPGALTLDGAGNIYVADTGNSAIRKVTPAGVVTTLALYAGVTNPAGSTSGSGSTATPGPSPSTPAASPSTPATNGYNNDERSGGGGAPSEWFLGGLGALSLLRYAQQKRRRFAVR